MTARLVLQGFGAWAPGLESRADWTRWAAKPEPLGRGRLPEVSFLPPLLRRRCDRLTRLLLRAARDACGEAEWRGWPTVFASRHGSVSTSVEMLAELAQRAPLSPTRFSHSVHNAPAGLFSIAAENRAPSSSVAAGRDTFPWALVEAAACLARSQAPGVLLVMGDEPIPALLTEFEDEPQASYAVALRLARGGDGCRLDLSPSGAGDAASSPPWPLAAEFLRAWLQGEPALQLGPLRVELTRPSGERAARC